MGIFLTVGHWPKILPAKSVYCIWWLKFVPGWPVVLSVVDYSKV
jgi:hypothetical protein